MKADVQNLDHEKPTFERPQCAPKQTSKTTGAHSVNSAKLNDWMQVVGIFAVVASLIFVGLQMRADRSFAVIDAISSRVDATVGLADLIGNNKAVWVSGLSGAELSDADQATFQAMTEAVDTYFIAHWVRLNSIGGADLGENVARGYAFEIYSHVGLRRAWIEQTEHLRVKDNALGIDDRPSRFQDTVSSTLAQLDKDAPPLPAVKRYILW